MYLQSIWFHEVYYGALDEPKPKWCAFSAARLSSSPNESFLPKSCLSLHFVDSSGVVIGSEFMALAQKEARRGEREQN